MTLFQSRGTGIPKRGNSAATLWQTHSISCAEYPLFLKSASFLLWDVRRTYMLYIKAIFRQPPFNCRYFSC